MFEQVKDILEGYSCLSREEITLTSNLQKDLKLNSLDVINIVVEFEEAFDMEIEESAIRAFQVVGDLVDYLEHNAPQGVWA